MIVFALGIVAGGILMGTLFLFAMWWFIREL